MRRVRLTSLIVVIFVWGGFLPVAAAPLTVGLLAGTGGLGDQSYNDMTYAGLGKAQKEFGFNLIFEETGDSHSEMEAAMQRLIDKASDIIVANGSGLQAIVQSYAARFPEKRFLINDYPISDLPNVTATLFAQHEGSFLAGVLAGKMTDQGKVAFIGGVDLPVIHAFRLGFKQGLAHANPGAECTAYFVSKGDDFSGFGQPAKGYQMAKKLYAEGVDIIFSVAGLTGNGIIQAAKEARRYVIGVDADQDHMAKGYVLTSMMKRLDRATYQEVTKMVEGTFKPGVQYYSLANGGVSLSPMKFTRHLIPEKVINQLKTAESQIIGGQIKVTNYLTVK